MINDTMELTPAESPTVGAILEVTNPWLFTWFCMAIMAAIAMVVVIVFSVWVYTKRMGVVSEAREQLYEGWEPPVPVASKADVEAGEPAEMADEPNAANQHRQ